MKINKNNGFTLFEVLIAITLAGSILGSLSYLLMSAMKTRRDAQNLHVAVILAQKVMNEIKTSEETKSDNGTFDSNEGYSFEYTIEEVEKPIIDFFLGTDSTTTGDDTENSTSNSDMIMEYMKSNGLIQDTSQSITIKMLQYHVTIKYGNNQKYEINFFRGKEIVL